MRSAECSRHWDDAYSTRGTEGVSWFQAEPTVSLELIGSLGLDRSTPVVDVGGGASVLVDELLGAGYTNVSVLDVSAVALDAGRRRIGSTTSVKWLHEDLLTWVPARRFGLWHDRAVFHFLTDEDQQGVYLETLRSALTPGGSLVLATFAEDGPEHCSGLRVARYSFDELLSRLGSQFEMTACRRELHTTPGGAVQPFTWIAGTVGRA
jgi:trans-aconitate methyltransferase